MKLSPSKKDFKMFTQVYCIKYNWSHWEITVLTWGCTDEHLFLAHKHLWTSLWQRCTKWDFQTDVSTTATTSPDTERLQDKTSKQAAQTINHFPGEWETNLNSIRAWNSRTAYTSISSPLLGSFLIRHHPHFSWHRMGRHHIHLCVQPLPRAARHSTWPWMSPQNIILFS